MHHDDQVFGSCYEGLEFDQDLFEKGIPEDWLQKIAERVMTSEEMANIKSLGGWDKLMETLRERMEEQNKRHQGGSQIFCVSAIMESEHCIRSLLQYQESQRMVSGNQ